MKELDQGELLNVNGGSKLVAGLLIAAGITFLLGILLLHLYWQRF